jgi:hypothetical protein
MLLLETRYGVMKGPAMKSQGLTLICRSHKVHPDLEGLLLNEGSAMKP